MTGDQVRTKRCTLDCRHRRVALDFAAVCNILRCPGSTYSGYFLRVLLSYEYRRFVRFFMLHAPACPTALQQSRGHSLVYECSRRLY